MVRLREAVMEGHHKQFSAQWVTATTAVAIYFVYLRWAFHLYRTSWGAQWQYSDLTAQWTVHITVISVCSFFNRLSSSSRPSRVIHRAWGADGWGRKRTLLGINPTSNLWMSLISMREETGLRAGLQGNSLRLPPYKLVLSRTGSEAKPTAEQIQQWQYKCKGHAVLSSWLTTGRPAEETATSTIPVSINSVNCPFSAVHYSSYKDCLPKTWIVDKATTFFASCPW